MISNIYPRLVKYKANRKIFRYLTFSNLKKGTPRFSYNISDKNDRIKLIVIALTFCWSYHNITI